MTEHSRTADNMETSNKMWELDGDRLVEPPPPPPLF